MGLAEVLFVVFLVLKLTSVIDWSWWWVTAPLWVSLAFLLLVIIGAGATETAATKLAKRL
ncbi:MAG: hypothetical protein EKK42_20235 [Pseudonocardiaceae bacterium]|nr:MAG: hypothetical protein EKK42_20235 [Pseudonocardiaceae bacterium]